MNTVVVGVDGSEHGEAALAFAAEEAALRGAHLLIVCAWQTPTMVSPEGFFPEEVFEGLAENARSITEAAVARVAELQPLATCEGKTVEGQPAAVLLKEAEQAVMIVVGSRGRGGFANLLLGSVTQQVVHHAPCPVVVVRLRLTTRKGPLDPIPEADAAFDLVAVRGAFFFLTPSLLREVKRVLKPGGFGWVGGGYGPTTPDEVIAPIAHQSRMLNEAVGKRRITPEQARVMAGTAGLGECTRVVTEGGLWLEVRA